MVVLGSGVLKHLRQSDSDVVVSDSFFYFLSSLELVECKKLFQNYASTPSYANCNVNENALLRSRFEVEKWGDNRSCEHKTR